MRLHRFYISTPLDGDTFDIAHKELVHQWKNVFRYNVGSQVILFDGRGQDLHCLITRLGNIGTTVSVMKRHTSAPLPRSVFLCMSLVKKDNFELITQKVTEIGVAAIVPILSEHTEKKKINMERLRKIAIEASEQSGRGDVPKVYDLATLSSLFEEGVLPEKKIALHLEGEFFTEYVRNSPASSIAIFLGPEGGWSDKEIEFFKSHDVPLITLGHQVLRAETAAIAAASLLLIS